MLAFLSENPSENGPKIHSILFESMQNMEKVRRPFSLLFDFSTASESATYGCRWAAVLRTQNSTYGTEGASPIVDWLHLLKLPEDEWFMVRPEFVQDAVRVIRTGIGNLPDASPGDVIAGKRLVAVSADGGNTSKIIEGISTVMDTWQSKELDGEFARAVSELTGESLLHVLEAMIALGEQMDRDILREPTQVDWDGVQPLSNLFTGELVPIKEGNFLDQKFIDYLVANEHRLDGMHWRNFERLTAEFFRRENYQVSLGPGSKDGGVDLRIWPDEGAMLGPPLLLIQCKRLKKGKLVKLEYVKSLWADVVNDGATGGLIATTSRVSPEGKRIATARSYPLTFAENEQVRGWVRGMWRHPFDLKQKSVCVGVYLLPPAYPISKPPWIETPEKPSKDDG